MSDFNPYQSPAASSHEGSSNDPDDDFWHDGKLLVMRRNVRWPDRCVRCNAASTARISFHAATRGVVVLRFGACKLHHRRHRIGKWVHRGGIAAVLIACFVASWGPPAAIWTYPLTILVYALAAVAIRIWAPPIAIKSMNARFVWLARVSPDFLAETPPWTPRR